MGYDDAGTVDAAIRAQVAVSRVELIHRMGKHLLTISRMDRTGADLLTNLLCINPARRPTAEQALEHVWFWSDPMPARLGT